MTKLIKTTTALALSLAAAAALGSATGCASKSESPSSDAAPGATETTSAETTSAETTSTTMSPTTPAAEATIAEKDMTHVVSQDEPFFASMPTSGKPASGTLKAGTKVVVLMPRGSYSQVMTADGKRVYTTTAALKPVGS